MEKEEYLFVTDANLDYMNSTRKLLIDAMHSNFAKENYIHFICASSKSVYQAHNLTIIKVPFYKSHIKILRTISEIYFQLVLCFHLCVRFSHIKKIAIIVPPIGAFISVMWARKILNKEIYLIQRDLFPYNYLDTNALRENSFIFKFFRRLFKFQLENSTKVGFENSRDLEKVQSDFPNTATVLEVMPNWITLPTTELPSLDKKLSNKIIYCGSIGHMQDTPQIETFIHSLEKQDFYSFDIYGFGPDFKKLSRKYLEFKQTTFHSAVDDDELDDLIRNYKYGIVTLRSSDATNNLPGKLFLYLRANLIVIGTAAEGSALACIVNDNGVGLVNSADQENALFKGVNKIRSKKFENLHLDTKKILCSRDVNEILKRCFIDT
jgi:glycosyltransferase involved in cell wall biosynthesis